MKFDYLLTILHHEDLHGILSQLAVAQDTTGLRSVL